MEDINEWGSHSRDIRDDQDIIGFMLDLGISCFQGKYCTLAIKYFPIYKGIRIPYGIRECDSGMERLHLNILTMNLSHATCHIIQHIATH